MQVTFSGNPLTLVGNQLQIGDKAPDFKAVCRDLSEFTLANVKASKKVISVVPSLDTPVCSLQTQRFNKEAAAISDTEIITISMDLPFALDRFANEHEIRSVTIISDHKDRDFASKYGLLISELGLLSRAILVLDSDNTIKYVEYVSEITNEPKYDEALKVLASI